MTRAPPLYRRRAAARHRYFIVVEAVDLDHVSQMGVQPDSTLALAGFNSNAGGHLPGRAVITPWDGLLAQLR
jgi:hypothetical protein